MAIAALMLEKFNDPGLNEESMLARLAWMQEVVVPRLERYLGYYRNAASDLADVLPCPANAAFLQRPFRQYQELGLPARITGFRRAANGACTAVGAIDQQRKEVVIENDIAWRVDTLVDFAAARLPGITSTARDAAQRARLTPVIQAILESAADCGRQGTLRLLQELVLQGAIFGSAWVQIEPTAELLAGLNGALPAQDATEIDVCRWLRLKVLNATRICPVNVGGCEEAPEYIAVLRGGAGGENPRSNSGGIVERVRTWLGRGKTAGVLNSRRDFSFDLFGADHWQRYESGILAEEADHPLRVVPFVRYENAPDPAAGSRVGPRGSAAVDAGCGDVEPLIGLQDELNTRLSDRAFRVTMSSFRMFLGKGIDDFIKRPVGPGQMWGTDNLDASIEAFGGDASAPSEESHINEVREALDKISGVSPVAAGLIRGKLGNLTSAIALRLTLIALLARTERKRVGLTQTLSAVVAMALELLDRAGVVKSVPEDRGIDVNWPTALPESDIERLTEAQAKLGLGVPREVVLTELGYGELVEGTRKGATERVSGGDTSETRTGGVSQSNPPTQSVGLKEASTEQVALV